MLEAWQHATRSERLNLILLVLFLLTLLFFGGASRADEIGQAVVRTVSILVLAWSCLQFDRTAFSRARWPIVFIGACMLLPALQLLPLPPAIWGAIPGHQVYAQELVSVGIPPVWRPLSITPDETLNSLLALLPPAAALSLLALLSRKFDEVALTMLLVMIAVSVALGILQISSGTGYLFRITNEGSAVGSFSNRNHAAVFVAASLPLLACWVGLGRSETRPSAIRAWVALCAAATVFPVILITGSRAGLVLGSISAVVALAILATAGVLEDRRRLTALAIAMVVVVATIVIFATFSRDEALLRIFGGGEDDVRGRLLPVYVKMAGDYFPFGAGFGSFEWIYRMYEPQLTMTPSYLNEAHDDLAQIVIEGGAPAIMLAAAYLGWMTWRSIRHWSGPARRRKLLGRAASAVVLLLTISSLFDYPLRTPLMATVMAFMAVWLSRDPEDSHHRKAVANQLAHR